MMRPAESLNWYEPGLSGMVEGTGRCTLPLSRRARGASGWNAGSDVGRYAHRAGLVTPAPDRFRGRQPRGGRPGCPRRPRAEPHTPRGISTMLRRQAPLPDRYTLATPDELDAWIADAKASLGERVLILGHHYQRDEVIKW